MAGSLSNFIENKVLDDLFGGVAHGLGANLFIAVGTATAGTDGDAGINNEVSGNAYARVQIARNQTNFPAAANGAISNGIEIVFPEATGSWGTITQVFVMTLATGGNVVAWGDLAVAKPIGADDTLSFDPGDLDLTLT